MRPFLLPALLTTVFLGGGSGFPQPNPALGSDPVLVEAGPHHRRWNQVVRVVGLSGAIEEEVRSYVEVATGLNRLDPERGGYVPAKAEFERTAEGYFVARQTQHQVILGPDLSVEGSVDLLTPDGLRLRSRPVGLALVDPGTGTSVMLGEVRGCEAEWVAANEVLYRDAFEGLSPGDIGYRLTERSFEQNVILREQIPPELVVAAGMDPLRARVVVLSEFYEAPEPEVVAGSGGGGDWDLRFGAMTVGEGVAFGVEGGGSGARVRIGKSWEKLEGRQFLIESVEYVALGPLLEGLPMPGEARIEGVRGKVQRTAAAGKGVRTAEGWELPVLGPGSSGAQAQTEAPRFENGGVRVSGGGVEGWAQAKTGAAGVLASSRGPGVVLDYSNYNSSHTNYTFSGDTTYAVLGTVDLYETTRISGGAVLKFGSSTGATVVCHGPVDCATGPWRPAVFTSMHDNSIGTTISGSTGNPYTNYCGNPALRIKSSGQALHDLRIAHAQVGLWFDAGSAGSASVSHAQLVRCGTSIVLEGNGTNYTELALRNVLVHDTERAIEGYSFRAQGEHLTVHQCGQLAVNVNTNYGTTNVLSLKNTIQVAVTSTGNVPIGASPECQSVSSSEGVFTTVGAGGFYLAKAEWRNAGTTNINGTLLEELGQRTTYPPLERSGPVSVETSLSPQAERGGSPPSLGYYYAPVDYLVSWLAATNGGVVRLEPGVVVATSGGVGLSVEDYGRLEVEGAPMAPVRLMRYHAVQEQSTNLGAVAYEPSMVAGPNHGTSGGEAPPRAGFRWLRSGVMGGYGKHLWSECDWFLFRGLGVKDSGYEGGKVQWSGGMGSEVGLTNNVFEGVGMTFIHWPVVGVYNNLVRGGTNRFEHWNTNAWTVRDNAFEGTYLTNIYGGITHDHNGYLGTGQVLLGGTTSSNVVVGTFVYTNGPLGALARASLGEFYHLSTNLVNAGSRSASAAGLYHHTTQADGTKEGTSTVDIGFHYPSAVLTNGVVVLSDADGDGLPDYLEDTDGDGNAETGETDWQESENGTTGGPGLQVFTLLERIGPQP